MAKAKKSVTEVLERAPKTPDNLGQDDEHALLIHHFNKLREQETKMLAAKEVYDAERATMTDIFRLAKAEGDFSRKELQTLLDDSKATRRDLQAEEERRAKLRTYLGLPSGAQMDLFAGTPVETRDDLDFHGEGYASGLRGDPGSPPDTVPARFVQSWMRGWGEGQEKLAWGLAAAGKIVDRTPDANATPVALDPEPEDEEELTEAAIKAGVKNLKNSGFMEPSPEPAEVAA